MPDFRLRAGRKVRRNLYLQTGPEPSDADLDIGRVDSPELAAIIVVAVNRMVETSKRPDWPTGDDIAAAVQQFLEQPSATDGGPEQGDRT
jgi:hypothetical protein